MKILIDNGHGINTLGKCSPLFSEEWKERYGIDRFREYKYCREIAMAAKSNLYARGYDVELIVPEERDIPLSTRVARVNNVCRKYGAKNVVLVSIHNNAAGSGKWMQARGWQGYVYTKGSERSKHLAQLLYEEAEGWGLRGNRSVPPVKYWTANFYILKNTNCPAVLTENLFQDNEEDVAFLLSAEGRKIITDIHVKGIVNYVKNYGR